MTPRISFVFCTQSWAHVRDFASELEELQARLPEWGMELLVVGPNIYDLDERLQALTEAGIESRWIASAWGNRNASRNLGFSQARGEWVYFLDQDVRLPIAELEPMVNLLSGLEERASEECLISGRYLSPAGCGFWGQCYNWLSNLWLENSVRGERVLAGNVLVRKAFFSSPPFATDLVDGGEEIRLCHEVIQRNGRICIAPELAVRHLAAHDFRLFWTRLLSHCLVKNDMHHETKATRLSFGLLVALGEFPLGILALSVLAAAHVASRLPIQKWRRTFSASYDFTKARGLSLVELLVALGIGTLALSIVALLFLSIGGQFKWTKERFQAEEDVYNAQILLQGLFSQAVNVSGQDLNTLPADLGGNPGAIADGINFQKIADSPTDWTTLAIFQKESAVDDPGSLTKVGLFYRRPDPAAKTSGVIFITQSNAAGAMTPSYADNFIDRVVLLQITKHKHLTFDKVVSVDVRLQVRYQTRSQGPASWCPEADIVGGTAGCSDAVGRRNIDRYFTILLRNNLLHPANSGLAASGVQSEERVLGNLYFFRSILPTSL